jgi:hypothetical protein
VIYTKHRLIKNDKEHLSVLVSRFFKSNYFKEASKTVSVCFKIKELLSEKDSIDILDYYRDKL